MTSLVSCTLLGLYLASVFKLLFAQYCIHRFSFSNQSQPYSSQTFSSTFSGIPPELYFKMSSICICLENACSSPLIQFSNSSLRIGLILGGLTSTCGNHLLSNIKWPRIYMPTLVNQE